MDRREFVKMLGAGGLLLGVGALLGGCPDEPEAPEGPDLTPPVDEPEPMPPDEPEDEAAAVEDGVALATVACPNCGAENDVEEWGVEMTCWKCGHTWTPQEPA